MAQSKEIAALRVRLNRRGYTDVRITALGGGSILVSALEPLAGMGVQTVLVEEEIRFAARW